MFNKLKSLFANYIPLDEAIKPYDELPAELKPLVTPFGSRVFGGATQYSDLDLLVHEKFIKEVQTILHANRIKYRAKKETYSFTINNIGFVLPSGVNVDISFADRRSYPEESQAAQIFALYSKHCEATLHKKERIAQYTVLCKDVRNKRLVEPYVTLIKTHAPELLI